MLARALAALLLPGAALAAPPPDISYSCVDAAPCDAELALCAAYPRGYVLSAGGDARALAAPLCACWADAYRCYADCSGKFPPDFMATCTAACPPPALGAAADGVATFDVCAPRLNSFTGGLLPQVSGARAAAPAPLALALVAAAAVVAAAWRG